MKPGWRGVDQGRYRGAKRRKRCTLAVFRLVSVYFAVLRGSEHSIDRDPQPEALRPFLPSHPQARRTTEPAKVNLKSRDQL